MTGQHDSNSPQWQSGPIDWEDVPAIERALEAWANGARLDFDVTEDMFYPLLDCAGADDEWFEFSAGKVRWKDQAARDHRQRQLLAKTNAVANLDIPTTLSAAARWYVFAQAFIPCSLPGWVPRVLEAASWDEARAVLEAAHDDAHSALTDAAHVLANTPKKPALAFEVAEQQDHRARQLVEVVLACDAALEAARRDAPSVPGASVIVQVHGREAIPVRALPYVTGWSLSPGSLAKLLHNTSDLWRSRYADQERGPWLTAYRLLPDGSFMSVAAADWELVVIAVEGFDSELDATEHDRDDGYARWRRQAMTHFPAGYFVWRDEFEDRVYTKRAFERAVRLEDPGQLNYMPVLLDGMRDMLLAGFQAPVADGDCPSSFDILQLPSVPAKKRRDRKDADLSLVPDIGALNASEHGRKIVGARWQKLQPVKDWLKDERARAPDGKPTHFVRMHLEEIKQRCERAGAKLSGSDQSVITTAMGWLREGAAQK